MIKLIREIPHIGTVSDNYKSIADLPSWLMYYDIINVFFQYLPSGRSILHLHIKERYDKYETH